MIPQTHADQSPEPTTGTVVDPVTRAVGAGCYLYELARQFRSADPAIGALGRQMRETRER